MRKILIKTGLALWVFICASSCSKWIWEDREECPCCLTLDLQHIPPEVTTMHLWAFGANNQIVYRDTLERKTLGKEYTILIERGEIRYFVWGNIKDATEVKDDSTLDISLVRREGFSADSLYFYSKEMDTRCEYATDTIFPRKEFATVNLLLKNYHGEADSLTMKLRSTSMGFYVDGRFLSGEVGVNIHPYQIVDGDAFFSSRISRQASLKDIQMHIASYYKGEPVLIADYPLGKWLSDNGYDMQAFNLSDIAVTLDFSTNFITIRTEDWQATLPVDIEL